MKQTNRLATLEFEVTNSDGTAVDLTGATVTYAMWPTTPGTDTLTPIAPVVTPVEPIEPETIWTVTVEWDEDDLQTAGRYYGRADITFANGNILTVPNVGNHQILVDALGPVA